VCWPDAAGEAGLRRPKAAGGDGTRRRLTERCSRPDAGIDYKDWSEKPLSITEFGHEMGKQFAKKKVHGNFRYVGLRVRDHGTTIAKVADDINNVE